MRVTVVQRVNKNDPDSDSVSCAGYLDLFCATLNVFRPWYILLEPCCRPDVFRIDTLRIAHNV